MIKLHERYVVAKNGKKVSVLLPVARYRKLLQELEELEAIRAYDAAKASRDKAIPFQQAKAELRRHK
jgi:PHD/YefM family antitoxin component YafN of YafNO toxin-antitoxin module